MSTEKILTPRQKIIAFIEQHSNMFTYRAGSMNASLYDYNQDVMFLSVQDHKVEALIWVKNRHDLKIVMTVPNQYFLQLIDKGLDSLLQYLDEVIIEASL